MKPTSVLLPAAAFLALCASRLDAGDAPAPDDPKARGQAFAAGLKAFDPALAGASWYGIHMAASPKNMGTAKAVVEKSTEAGTAYRVVTEIRMAVGPTTYKFRDESYVDASGSIVRQETTEELGEEKKVTSVKREGDKWTGKVVKGDAARISRHEAAVTSHWDMASQFVLLRQLPLDKPCTYVVQGIDWPEPEGEGEADQPLPPECLKDVKITVPAASKVTHRGAEIQAYQVKVERSGKDVLTFVIDEKHAILEILPSDAPVRMIGGTEKEAAGDLPVSEAERAREGGIREAVGVYLDVIAGVKEPSALDAVMDWKAVQETLGGSNPVLAVISVEDFASFMKEQFQSNVDPGLKEQIGLLKDLIGVKVDGDSAAATLPGKDETPFQLSKVDGKWKIVRLPN
ncbi:MAG: hypothetical protein MUC63_00405 [Planctomycetes bacterium]|nr:hypothetical protein [Planctomycetota bacterium]